VFLGAYNTKMGAELKQRTAGIPGVFAGTFHSKGFSTYRYAMKGGRIETEKNKVRDLIVAPMLAGTDDEEWESAICQVVGMAKQRGFFVRNLIERPTNSDWMDIITRFDVMDRLPDDADPYDLIKYSQIALEKSNQMLDVIDFDDMLYLPLLRNCRFYQQDWVLIDEAQDTNPVRREMARRMLNPRTGRLIAVGDPHQAIFGFTGADSDSLDIIRNTFNAETLDLNVSWRCPRLVVQAARQYVDHIQPAETAPLGEHLEMDLKEALALTTPGDALLCRYNKHLVDTCFKLIRMGKAAKIEGRAIGEGLAALAGRWKKVRTLDQLVDKLEEYTNREVEKARAKKDDAKEERLVDQHETMLVLIQRAGEQGITTVGGLKQMILDMFGDNLGSTSHLVILSSIHKAKGLEWPRVYILGRKQLMPSPYAKQAWAQEQEKNLAYVAITRAQAILIDVNMPITQKEV
jgi:superfamily I DNA/RNA helicase